MREGMKRIFARVALVAFVSLTLFSCGGGGGSAGGGGTPPPPETKKSWTYMIYMGGDNNLSEAAKQDILEMKKAGSDAKINIVLQAEFSTNPNFGTLPYSGYKGETMRYLVQTGTEISGGTSIGNVDMASPQTLTDFINWAKTNYPADHFVLVIWDHGAGWKAERSTRFALRGAVQDQTSGSFMSLPNLAKAVRDSGLHFDIINFDACLMAMYEVAYEFKGICDFLVASEETEPGDGDPYDTILNDLKANPAMTGRTLATTIVNNYYNFYISERTDGITKSAIDMSKLSDLDAKILQLSGSIISEFSSVSGAIASAQNTTQQYHYTANHDLYDFCKFLFTNLPSGQTKTVAADVMAAIDNAVVTSKWYGDKVKNSHGIAIYSPAYNEVSSDSTVNDLTNYAKLACNQIRANSWYDAVLKMASAPTHVLKQGGFAFYVSWDTDADVDLYVWEPVDLYAAWMGKTTPNGFFSGDSADTGISEEFYVANDWVEAGEYDFLITYFLDGSSKFANVTFFWIDPLNNITEWQKFGPVPMDLTLPYSGDFSDITALSQLNAYSNWWYPGQTTRSTTYTSLRIGERVVNIRFGVKKTKPDFTNIRK